MLVYDYIRPTLYYCPITHLLVGKLSGKTPIGSDYVSGLMSLLLVDLRRHSIVQ